MIFWLAISFILVFILAYRIYWVKKSIKSYTNLANLYLQLTLGTPELADRLSQIWPYYELYFNWKHWNMRYYVIYQEDFDDMVSFMTKWSLENASQ